MPYTTKIENSPLNTEPVYKKAIFYAFIPQRIEYLVWEDEIDKPSVQELKKQGVTIIPVPRTEKEHEEKRITTWE